MNAEQSRLTARARVFSRLVIDSSGCLLWTAGKTKCGYGRIMIGGQQSLVHRVMFEWFIGPVPAGMFLDHLCRASVGPDRAGPGHAGGPVMALRFVTGGQELPARRPRLGRAWTRCDRCGYRLAKCDCDVRYSLAGRQYRRGAS